MQSNSINDALDFMPGVEQPSLMARVGKAARAALATATDVVEALREGNAAAQRYEALVSRGMDASAASAKVFAEFHGSK